MVRRRLQNVYFYKFCYIWQARYTLPILAFVMIVAAISVLEGRGAPRSDRRYVTLLSVLMLFQIVTFVFVLKRFSISASIRGVPASDQMRGPPGGV